MRLSVFVEKTEAVQQAVALREELAWPERVREALLLPEAVCGRDSVRLAVRESVIVGDKLELPEAERVLQGVAVAEAQRDALEQAEAEEEAEAEGEREPEGEPVPEKV